MKKLTKEQRTLRNSYVPQVIQSLIAKPLIPKGLTQSWEDYYKMLASQAVLISNYMVECIIADEAVTEKETKDTK